MVNFLCNEIYVMRADGNEQTNITDIAYLIAALSGPLIADNSRLWLYRSRSVERHNPIVPNI